jgi:hypothetical protein
MQLALNNAKCRFTPALRRLPFALCLYYRVSLRIS